MAVTGVIAAVTTITLIAGELDLSIGAALGLGGIVSATVLTSGAPLPFVLASGVLIGVVVGLIRKYPA